MTDGHLDDCIATIRRAIIGATGRKVTEVGNQPSDHVAPARGVGYQVDRSSRAQVNDT